MGYDTLWLASHGLTVAEHYNKIAEKLCARWHSEALPSLAFLPIEDENGKNYMREMQFCVELALVNRKVMMQRVIEGIQNIRPNVEFEPMINKALNYAVWENHFGENVIVHRKGATRTQLGEIGIIPECIEITLRIQCDNGQRHLKYPDWDHNRNHKLTCKDRELLWIDANDMLHDCI